MSVVERVANQPGSDGSTSLLRVLQSLHKPVRDSVIASLVIFLSACAPLLYLWNKSSKALVAEVRTSLQETARSAVLLVDGDLHRTFTNREMEKGEAYQSEVTKLRRFIESNPRLAYIYTTILKDGKVYFILDAAPPGDADHDGVDDHSYIMDEYGDASDEMIAALREGISMVDHQPYKDKWGTFISGYAPVRDRAGNVVGILGADIRAEEIVESLSGIQRSALGGIGLAFFISVVMGFGVWTLRSRAMFAQREMLSALEQREHAEMRYRRLFEQTPIGVMYFSRDLFITDCNQRFVELVKSSRESLVGLDMHNLKDTRILPCLKEVLGGKDGHYFGPYTTTASGKNIWIEMIAGPVRNAGGQVMGGICTVEDISARHRTEEMSNAEKRLLAMITMAESLDDILLRLVQNMEAMMPGSICSILFLNDEGKRLVSGIAPNLPPEYNAAIHNLEIGPQAGSCGTAAYTGQLVIVADIQTSPLWKDARELASPHNLRSCWSMPIRSSHGKIMGTFAIYRREVYTPTEDEITLIERAGYLAGIAMERSRFERELSQERNLLRTLVDNMPDVVFIKDRQHRYLAANRAAAEFLGVENENSLIGRTDSDLFPAQIAEANFANEQRVLAGTPAINDESTIITKDGKVVFMASSRMPLKNQSGEIMGLIMIGRDVTDQRRVQEERIKTQKLESLGLLAGGIAHDFNNILTSILGNLSQIRASGDPLDGENQNLLMEAEAATFRAKDLTQQLLTFAKGGLPIKKPASVAEIVKDSADLAVHGSACRVEFDFQPDLWIADVDEGQISQVVQNLVINAEQAMPGGGTIHITGRNLSLGETNSFDLTKGHYVSFAVADTGSGIPPNIVGKIFDPYFTTKQAGNGLGLTTTFSILKKHGGHISVISSPGKGSTFTFLLPALPSESVTRKIPGETVAPATQHARILLMDDEEAILKISTRILEKTGYAVVVARHGRQAIELFRKAHEEHHPFDVVILDLTIPGGMGGQETFEHLKKIDPSVKAIVSSGYSVDDVLSRHESFGFCGVVTKPYHRDDLIAAIKAALSSSIS